MVYRKGRGSLTLQVSVVFEGNNSGARGLGPWLAHIAPRTARGAVTVAIVSDRQVKALNRAYRGIDTATAVLSCPAVERAQ
ncbi:MAG: hypothetical protein EHM55_22655, partial [Acidobacteria bacterium]